jgi:Fe-S cluster assembly protein SufB
METQNKETQDQTLDRLANQEYQHGFETAIDMDIIPPGLSEDVVALISRKKEEPGFMLDWRLGAYRHWLEMKEPTWANVHYPTIDYQAISYFAAPKRQNPTKTLEDVDPEILRTYERLGIPLSEQKMLAGIAVDAVMDSVSVATTYQKDLERLGIIFCSMSEAVKNHPELVRKYLGTVVPPGDNFFAALNSAVYSDGSFAYIPKGVRCPIPLTTYFRINAKNTGQFERTLLIADEGAYVDYVEGCTAPMRDENQLHAAVVELVAHKEAEINYVTVQNWYPGDKDGKGGIYNFVTKRGKCAGDRSKISWTQVEVGSAITWKYPSCILLGDSSVGEFYSVAVVKNRQQADTGTKMIHIGKNTKSTILSKSISIGDGRATYRGMVKVAKRAERARNYSRCDSLLIGRNATANTVPVLEIDNTSATIEHEATTSKIGLEQLFYLRSRGLDEEAAVGMIVNGFVEDVVKRLPLEYSVEARRLLELRLEGSVG